MRRYLFVSMASAADSFRSMCNSERSAPECSKQRCPAATPHVGQGTEDNCAGVRSFILMGTGCLKKCGKAVRFGTLSRKNRAAWGAPTINESRPAPARRRVFGRLGNFLGAVTSNLITKECVDGWRGEAWPG